MMSEVSKLNRKFRSLQNQKVKTFERIQGLRTKYSELNREIQDTRSTIHQLGGSVRKTVSSCS